MKPLLSTAKNRIAAAALTLAAAGTLAFAAPKAMAQNAFFKEHGRETAQSAPDCAGISRADTILNQTYSSPAYQYSVGPYAVRATKASTGFGFDVECFAITLNGTPVDSATLASDHSVAVMTGAHERLRIRWLQLATSSIVFTTLAHQDTALDVAVGNPAVWYGSFGIGALEVKAGDDVFHRDSSNVAQLVLTCGGKDSVVFVYLGDPINAKPSTYEFRAWDGSGAALYLDVQDLKTFIPSYLGKNYATLGICGDGPSAVREPRAPASTPAGPLYPNPLPAGATAYLRLDGAVEGRASVTLYNLLGGQVARLWDGPAQPVLALDIPSGLPAGAYYCSIRLDGQAVERKPLLILK
ncbi:MAG: T9SS type A sorting domain-containing protein [Candidatus Micrarchaeota archaeon]|nr:T9SS type A sorting domain-containing protein [Candidatus Micrarchaeota archaeon]